jgi:hypothetical protein
MKKRHRRDDLRMNGVSRHRAKRGNCESGNRQFAEHLHVEPARPCAGNTCREAEIGLLNGDMVSILHCSKTGHKLLTIHNNL